MAEIVSGVLHNVGNVLNSLGAANTSAQHELKGMRLDGLARATTLLSHNRDTATSSFADDERGRHVPDYLAALSTHISLASNVIKTELETTEKLLQHLGDIVNAQQEQGRLGGRRESLRLDEVVETALLVQAAGLAQIEVVRDYGELPLIVSDRHKLLQIVVNLIVNSRDAVLAGSPEGRRILVRLALDGNHVLLTIEDSGIGMSTEVLSQIWRFGFTTKKTGHGFGLHNSANAAQEIGATLTAHSDGIGKGARFNLRLPISHVETAFLVVAA